jgi:hypothetical protein
MRCNGQSRKWYLVANAMSLGAIGGLTRACNTTYAPQWIDRPRLLLTAITFSLTFAAFS